jgi:hypothetical protein
MSLKFILSSPSSYIEKIWREVGIISYRKNYVLCYGQNLGDSSRLVVTRLDNFFLPLDQ